MIEISPPTGSGAAWCSAGAELGTEERSGGGAMAAESSVNPEIIREISAAGRAVAPASSARNTGNRSANGPRAIAGQTRASQCRSGASLACSSEGGWEPGTTLLGAAPLEPDPLACFAATPRVSVPVGTPATELADSFTVPIAPSTDRGETGIPSDDAPTDGVATGAEGFGASWVGGFGAGGTSTGGNLTWTGGNLTCGGDGTRT